ncbi:MAG TPA: AI-2E family transporter [Candidatus Methylacidiphilales bacterium]|jgi:predicted PurR-regulated permease PerM|nr:AI-2E family transporter [Candidatus Methylacidiphilales bacterium]
MPSSPSTPEPTGEAATGKRPGNLRIDPAVRKAMEMGLGIGAIVAGGIILWYASQVLLLFFAAIFFSVFFSGLGRFLERHTRCSYPACVAFTLIGLLELLVIAGAIIGPAVADQSAHLSDALPKAYHQLLAQAQATNWSRHLYQAGQRAMQASSNSNWQSTMKFAGLTIHGLGGLAFALVIGIFLAFEPKLYRHGFLALFPSARRRRVGEVLDELGFTLWWWLMGQLVTMATMGIFIGAGLAMLGVPLAGTLGLMAALLSFIPSLGIVIAVVPAIMLGLTKSPTMGLWVALLYLGVQLVEANVVTPLVQRKAISLPPAFVLGSELLMGLLLGGAGLAFATPLVAVVLVLVNMLYIQDVLGEPGSLPSRKRK